MAKSFELGIISLLRDEYLQSLFLDHMDSDLIVEESAKVVFNAIKNTRTSDLSVITIELRKAVHNEELLNNLLTIMKQITVPIVRQSAITQSVFMLETYVRWRKTATQVAYMAAQDFLDSVDPQAGEKKHYEKLVESCTFSVTISDEKDTYQFSRVEDYNRAKELSMPGTEAVRSNFGLLNESFQYYGYIPGTVNAVVAPTGVGKSTFMVAEAVNFIKAGKKILHYVLGDWNGLDVCHKYIANRLKTSLNLISKHSDEYYEKDVVQHMFENVVHRVKASYEMDANEIYLDAVKWKEDFDYDVIVVDYDGNIRPSDKESMYTDGGVTYGLLEKLARQTNSVLLVGCQPKPDYWDKEILPLQSPNESSRKQHAIDCLITMSKPSSKIPLGLLHLPKVRRGITGQSVNVCYLNEFASILEISHQERESINKLCSQSDTPVMVLRTWAQENRGFGLGLDN